MITWLDFAKSGPGAQIRAPLRARCSALLHISAVIFLKEVRPQREATRKQSKSTGPRWRIYREAGAIRRRCAACADLPTLWEFVSGPIHAGTFGPNELDDTFGP